MFGEWFKIIDDFDERGFLGSFGNRIYFGL